MITNITIKNIKGFGDSNGNLNIELRPNKINLLIAPNGFGKSSIAAAFSGLQPRKLNINETDKYELNPTLNAKLSITIGGNTYTADKGKNEISKQIFPFVIKSKLKTNTIAYTFSGHTTTKSFFDIEKIKVSDVFPNSKIKYSIRSMRKSVGTNGKILSDISEQFNNYHFTEKVVSCFDYFEKFHAKSRAKLIEDTLSKINTLRGTEREIVDKILADGTIFETIESESNYQNAIAILDTENKLNSLERFMLFFQLLFLHKSDHANLTNVNKRRAYEIVKKNVIDSLALLNNTWKDVNVNETNKELIVSYPHADEISNGQRDILTFVVQLIAFRSVIPQNKPSILIIDEIFDYLDDANLIAAQYYLSDLIKKSKQDLYIVVLTHVDPNSFRSYVTNKILNVQTLSKSQPVGSAAMKTFIAFRENLNKEDPNEKDLYNKLSHYFFHYDPNTIDVSAQIPTRQNLRPSWGQGLTLHNYVIEECNKYFSVQQKYDPYAICVGIRLRLEKIVYDSLDDEEKKQGFIDTNETNKKMDYAQNQGVTIPDAYYYLSSIHNEADHLKDPNKDKACVFKLQHPVIKNIIIELFAYDGQDISIDAIH